MDIVESTSEGNRRCKCERIVAHVRSSGNQDQIIYPTFCYEATHTLQSLHDPETMLLPQWCALSDQS